MKINIDPRVVLQLRVETLMEEAERAAGQAKLLLIKSAAIKSLAESILKELKENMDRNAGKNQS